MLSLVRESQVPRKDIIPPALGTDEERLAIYKMCSMLEELCVRERGVGIAAVQVGLPIHIHVVPKNGRYDEFSGYFANCCYEILETSQKISTLEGCLSLRTPKGDLRMFAVPRHDKIRVVGTRLVPKAGKVECEPVDWILDGEASILHQHEIDHCHGIMISDIGREQIVWGRRC